MKHSLKKTTSVSDLRLSVRLVTVTCRKKKKKKTPKKVERSDFSDLGVIIFKFITTRTNQINKKTNSLKKTHKKEQFFL